MHHSWRKSCGLATVSINSIIISPQVVAAVGSSIRLEDIHRTRRLEEHLCVVFCENLLYLSSCVFYPFCSFCFFCRPSVDQDPERPHWERICRKEEEAIM